MTSAITYCSQAAIQAGVTHFESSNPWLFAQTNKIKNFVLALNVGAIFLGACALVDALDPRIGFYEGIKANPLYLGCVGVTFIACMALSVGAAFGAHLYFTPRDPLVHSLTEQQRGEGVSAEWSFAEYKVFKQAAHTFQLVVSVALVFFSATPHFYALSAACQLYSFIKTSKWMWIKVNRSIQNPLPPEQPGIVSTHVSYSYAVLPSSHRANCTHNHDDPNAYADTYWHADHYSCHRHAIQRIAGQINTIHTALAHPNAIVTTRRPRPFDRTDPDEMEHRITLPAHLLPSCPCGSLVQEAPHNEFAISVRYRFDSRRSPGTLIEKTAKAAITFTAEHAANHAAVVG
ncbi:MAG: hypothetical protein ACHQT8_05100 [Chlamydiales bacterium]